MQFTSYIFILVFMPVLVTGYFLLNRFSKEAGRIYLIIGGIAFYLYRNLEAGLIFALSILGTILFSLLIRKSGNKKKAALAAAVLFHIALLGYYKYTNFAIGSINAFFGRDFALKDILLPLGISFYTFQQIMYLVQVCQGKIAEFNLIDYLSYILYFPKLIMGPLAEPDELILQLKDQSRKKFRADHMAQGLKIFSFGFFKKMLLADTLAKAVSWGFGAPEAPTATDWILIMLCFTFEIYFDFSGYCDMGYGISRMLNIDLPVNFDSSYRADSIRDFWKRWHISLNAFFTKYLYIPLGGSRKGEFRACLNVMIVFLVSGLWHGANWTYVLWGTLQGAFCVFDRFFDKICSRLYDSAAGKIWKGVRWLFTFGIINVMMLLFRSESISQWIMIGKTIVKGLLRRENLTVSDGLLSSFVLPEHDFLTGLFHVENLFSNVRGMEMIIFLTASFLICLIPKNNIRNREKLTVIGLAASAIAFFWAFLCLGSEAVFVYQGF